MAGSFSEFPELPIHCEGEGCKWPCRNRQRICSVIDDQRFADRGHFGAFESFGGLSDPCRGDGPCDSSGDVHQIEAGQRSSECE